MRSNHPAASHQMVELKFEARRFVAVCECGWATPPYSSAGLAQSALDDHAQQAARRD